MKANPIANEESLRVQREKKKNIGSESEKAELFFIFSRPLASVLCLIVPSFCFWGTTMEIKLMICFSCVILTINFQWLKILLVTLLFFIVEYIFLKQFVKLLMVKYTYLLCYLLTYLQLLLLPQILRQNKAMTLLYRKPTYDQGASRNTPKKP